jgi:hypothetical protein
MKKLSQLGVQEVVFLVHTVLWLQMPHKGPKSAIESQAQFTCQDAHDIISQVGFVVDP